MADATSGRDVLEVRLRLWNTGKSLHPARALESLGNLITIVGGLVSGLKQTALRAIWMKGDQRVIVVVTGSRLRADGWRHARLLGLLSSSRRASSKRRSAQSLTFNAAQRPEATVSAFLSVLEDLDSRARSGH